MAVVVEVFVVAVYIFWRCSGHAEAAGQPGRAPSVAGREAGPQALVRPPSLLDYTALLDRYILPEFKSIIIQ